MMTMMCRVVSNDAIASAGNIYGMMIHAPEIAQSAQAGQFLHIKCGDALTLRRPISIANMHAGLGMVTICYEVRGEGTAWLAERKPGDKIDVLGPLGRGFDLSGANSGEKVLLVGGGIGIYPLYLVAAAYGERAHAALGFKSKSAVNYVDRLEDLGSAVQIATDDGSFGHKGFVTEVAREILDNGRGGFDMVMTCGPKAMMRGVYELAAAHGIRCQVSLEERMACGIGACLVCVCRADGENKRVCVDGPVFEGSEVDWDW